MKITGSRSYIDVEFEGKTLRINGELTSEPAFYADISSISGWRPPHEKEVLSEQEKKTIIEKIENESNDLGFPIIFS